MVLVKELKDIFDRPFIEHLPKECEYCGSDMGILENFTNLSCTNPVCPNKIEIKLSKMLTELGIELDKRDCESFIKEFKIDNPYSIFLYNPKSDGSLHKECSMEKSISVFKELNKKRVMMLWEYIKIGQLDFLGEVCEQLFGEYKDLDSLYTDLEQGGIEWVNNKLHNDSKEVFVDSILIYNSIINSKKDVLTGSKGVLFINPKYRVRILFANEYSVKKVTALNMLLKSKIYVTSTNILDDTVNLVYFDNYGLNSENTVIRKVRKEYPSIPIVDNESIAEGIMKVVANEKQAR